MSVQRINNNPSQPEENDDKGAETFPAPVLVSVTATQIPLPDLIITHVVRK